MEVRDVLTLLAILVGPIVAVLIARCLDDYRASRDRRMAIFKELMRTRRLRMSPEAVGAFNLVEIEFKRSKNVINKASELNQHFNKGYPRDATLEQLTAANKHADVLYAKLLHAMALELKFPVEQFEIIEGGYAPQGWEDDENDQRALRHALKDVLVGRKPILVASADNLQTANVNPFPPKPSEYRRMAQETQSEL